MNKKNKNKKKKQKNKKKRTPAPPGNVRPNLLFKHTLDLDTRIQLKLQKSSIRRR